VRSRETVYPWAVVGVFVALSAYANSLHAPDDPALRGMAAVPPVTAALAWHVLVLPSFDAAPVRRWLARLAASGVFGFAMWASFEALTALGRLAGLTPAQALPVCLDGLVVVAALALWSRQQVGATTEEDRDGLERSAEHDQRQGLQGVAGPGAQAQPVVVRLEDGRAAEGEQRAATQAEVVLSREPGGEPVSQTAGLTYPCECGRPSCKGAVSLATLKRHNPAGQARVPARAGSR